MTGIPGGRRFNINWRCSPKRIRPILFLTLPFVVAVTAVAQANPVINPGSSITESVSSGPGSKEDWVGLFRVGAPEDGFNTLALCFLSGTHAYPSDYPALGTEPGPDQLHLAGELE